MKEFRTEEATRFYDQRFCEYLAQGMSPGAAAESADLDLLEWSKPLPLPAAPDGAWWE